MKLTKNWREEIFNEYGIVTGIPQDTNNTLWVTRCSKTKSVNGGIPRELYVSKLNLRFYDYVESHNYKYGVLSDKYGLHLQDESLEYYNTHPSQLSNDDKIELGKMIAQKANGKTLVFYNTSPIQSIPYFEMLSHSGLTVYFTTKLP